MRRSARVRSRLSNTGLPAGINGGSAAARRYRDVIDDLRRELGALSAAEELQARSVATMTLALDRLQAELLRGELPDPEALTRLANAQARALSAIKRGRAGSKPASTGREALERHLAAKREADR